MTRMYWTVIDGKLTYVEKDRGVLTSWRSQHVQTVCPVGSRVRFPSPRPRKLMKRCVTMALVMTLLATVAYSQQITVIPYEVKGHSYLLTLVNGTDVAGTVHDPDCANPRHIDNQFEAYVKRNSAPQQKGGLPQGHPPITPQLKQQLKPKVQI